MNQHRLFYGRKHSKKITPRFLLVCQIIRPNAVLDHGIGGFDPKADEVIEVAVGQPLYVEIDRRAVDLQFRHSDDVDFLFADCQSPYRMMVFLAFVSQALWPPAWPEGVRKLSKIRSSTILC